MQDTLITVLSEKMMPIPELNEALFARRIRSAGGVVGPLATVFYMIAVAHALAHARDIAG